MSHFLIVRNAARLFLAVLCLGGLCRPSLVLAQGDDYNPPSGVYPAPKSPNPQPPNHPDRNNPYRNDTGDYGPDPKAAQEKDEEANRLLDKNRPQEALAVLREALHLDPQSANVYNDFGAAYMDLNQYGTALPFLKQAIRYNPRLEIAYRNIGLIYDRDDAAAAAPWYTRALQLNPKDAKAWAWRGYDYAVIGSPAKAFYDYKMALKLNPKYADAYHWRGKLELERGQDKAAYADLRKSRGLDPSEGVGIAKDIRTILAQRQARVARQQAVQFGRRQFLSQRRQIAAVVRQGPRYYTEVYQQARREGDSPEEARRKEQEARDRYDRDVALQNAWENGDYDALNRIESGEMSREEISSYEPSNSEPSNGNSGETESPQPEENSAPSEPMSEPAPEPAPEPSE